jgi:two-component system, LytTR family, response regulator
MAPIRVVIVDDEPLARRGIGARLARKPSFQVAAEAGTAAAGVREVRKHRPDVVFLDIEMPGADGFSLLERFPPAERPLVIFVTAHDDRAVKAFESEAFDYILKPIDDARFARTLDRVEARLAERGAAAPDRLVVRDRGKTVALEPATIDWVASDGDYVCIHAGVTSYLHHATLSSIAADLPAEKFVRVHRTAIVNVERIRDLEPLTNGDFSIRLTTGARLRLSRTYRDALSRRLRTEL